MIGYTRKFWRHVLHTEHASLFATLLCSSNRKESTKEFPPGWTFITYGRLPQLYPFMKVPNTMDKPAMLYKSFPRCGIRHDVRTLVFRSYGRDGKLVFSDLTPNEMIPTNINLFRLCRSKSIGGRADCSFTVLGHNHLPPRIARQHKIQCLLCEQNFLRTALKGNTLRLI